MFPTIEFFGRTIGSYALFAFLGFIACGTAITVLCKKINVLVEDSVILILITATGLLIGGHLLYGTVTLTGNKELIIEILNSPFKKCVTLIIKCFGGMVFYGGFLGGLVSLKIYQSFSKASFKNDIFDIYAFSIPLFHFFGRIGCFFAGCCYGIESKIGFTVTNNTLVPDINNVNRFPVALIEAFLNLLIFVFLSVMYRKKAYPKRLIYLYMLIYSPIRFFTEFLRGDSVRGFILTLSTSQWISIILFAVSFLLLLLHKKRTAFKRQS